MSNYKIKVKIDIVECESGAASAPIKQQDGSFEMSIDEAKGMSLDDCEQALLKTNYMALRDSLSSHFSELSKKKNKL